MNAATMTSALPVPSRARVLRPGATAALALFAFWTLVALLAAVADYSDQAPAGGPASLADKLVLYAFVFLPFALFSAALSLAFARRPGLLRPRRLLLLYAATVLLFLPVYAMYEVAIMLALAGQPVPGLRALFFQPSAWGRWLDALMVTMAFGLQCAAAWWQHARRQAAATRLAGRANLALRLSLLQGQLEPAFLLNALDGIAELVRHAERSQATRALARLSDLLRHALRASGQDWISVAEEAAFLRGYVELQALRFGERVQVDWTMGEGDWHVPSCPPLLLHALLDHAIARCLETGSGAGSVRVRFALEAGTVCVAVSHPQGAGPVDPGQALAETRERLALLYHGGASLQYSAAQGRVSGVLRLPAQEDRHG